MEAEIQKRKKNIIDSLLKKRRIPGISYVYEPYKTETFIKCSVVREICNISDLFVPLFMGISREQFPMNELHLSIFIEHAKTCEHIEVIINYILKLDTPTKTNKNNKKNDKINEIIRDSSFLRLIKIIISDGHIHLLNKIAGRLKKSLLHLSCIIFDSNNPIIFSMFFNENDLDEYNMSYIIRKKLYKLLDYLIAKYNIVPSIIADESLVFHLMKTGVNKYINLLAENGFDYSDYVKKEIIHRRHSCIQLVEVYKHIKDIVEEKIVIDSINTLISSQVNTHTHKYYHHLDNLLFNYFKHAHKLFDINNVYNYALQKYFEYMLPFHHSSFKQTIFIGHKRKNDINNSYKEFIEKETFVEEIKRLAITIRTTVPYGNESLIMFRRHKDCKQSCIMILEHMMMYDCEDDIENYRECLAGFGIFAERMNYEDIKSAAKEILADYNL